METREILCPRCQAMQKHTFRMYEKKDKFEQGKYKDAIKKYDKILKNDPSYINAIYGKTSCLITLGKFNEARPYVDELIR